MCEVVRDFEELRGLVELKERGGVHEHERGVGRREERRACETARSREVIALKGAQSPRSDHIGYEGGRGEKRAMARAT